MICYIRKICFSYSQSRNYRVRQGTRRVRPPPALMQQRAPLPHTCLLENGFFGIKLFLCSNHIKTNNNSCSRRNLVQPLQKICSELS